jgi:hypothetical protein
MFVLHISGAAEIVSAQIMQKNLSTDAVLACRQSVREHGETLQGWYLEEKDRKGWEGFAKPRVFLKAR